MKLVVIVLNNTEHLEDLLTAFLEIGVSGSTVIDSVGMGRILSHDVPIFAGLRSTFPGTSPVNKTILTVTSDELCRSAQHLSRNQSGQQDHPHRDLGRTH